MKYAHNALSIILAWYLLSVCFFVSFFSGAELPEVSSNFHYLIVIPYLGVGALIWSIFTGIGVIVLVLGIYFSFLYVQRDNNLILVWHLLVGIVGGFVFKLVSGT